MLLFTISCIFRTDTVINNSILVSNNKRIGTSFRLYVFSYLYMYGGTVTYLSYNSR